MAKSLEQFNQLILNDSTIQEQLKVTTDQAGFARLMVRLGAENGYSFTVADVEEQLALDQMVAVTRSCEKWTSVTNSGNSLA